MSAQDQHYCFNHHELIKAMEITAHKNLGCDVDRHSQAYYELQERNGAAQTFDCARGFKMNMIVLITALMETWL